MAGRCQACAWHLISPFKHWWIVCLTYICETFLFSFCSIFHYHFGDEMTDKRRWEWRPMGRTTNEVSFAARSMEVDIDCGETTSKTWCDRSRLHQSRVKWGFIRCAIDEVEIDRISTLMANDDERRRTRNDEREAIGLPMSWVTRQIKFHSLCDRWSRDRSHTRFEFIGCILFRFIGSYPVSPGASNRAISRVRDGGRARINYILLSSKISTMLQALL